MTSLCGPCRAEWLVWTDYKQPVPSLIRTSGVLPAVELRVRIALTQQNLIEDHCKANHQQEGMT